MKKLTIILTLTFFISLICFIISVILTTGFSTNLNFGILLREFDGGDVNYHFIDDYSNIELRVTSAKTIIKPSTDANTRIDYKNRNNPTTLEAEVTNNTLQIQERWGISFINWFTGHSELIIQIPEKDYNDISLRISSGSIVTENILVDCQNFSIKISSGNMKINGITFEEYTLNCSSGSVTLDNVSGKGDVKVSSGSVTLNYVEWNDSLNVKVSSGNVNFNLPEDAGMKVDGRVTSGSVKYNLGGNSGKLSTVSGARFGGENVQDVNVSVSSGSVNFNDN